jgi:hypothetical protein
MFVGTLRLKFFRTSIRKVAKDRAVWLVAEISVRNRRLRPKKDSGIIESYIYNLIINSAIMLKVIFPLTRSLR